MYRDIIWKQATIMKCLIIGVLFVFLQSVLAQESGESETLRFVYEGHTKMLIITRQATCYIFTLTPTELSMVHNDATLRQLELKFLGQINDPSTTLTPVPDNALHTNIHKECGKGMSRYYIIQ